MVNAEKSNAYVEVGFLLARYVQSKYTNFIIPTQLARNSCKIACIYFFVKVHKRACIVSRYAALLPTLNTQKTDVFWGSAGFVLF